MSFIAAYGVWVYALLFCIVFCETGLVITPFLPGDSLLFAAGVASASGGLSYGACMGVLLCAGILGDGVNYLIGRKIGPAIFERETRWIKKRYLLQAQAFYERHGGKAIFLARFIPIVRTFAPFVAGIAKMQPRYFYCFNCLGCITWVCGLVSVGYFFGNLPWVRDHFSVIVFVIIGISLLPVVIGFLRNRSQS
ncbi:MAG: VTT domain-containing protein [Desulfovibrio sp.]|nr:VTT domain-containing protein [Desulfovibrio sp.]